MPLLHLGAFLTFNISCISSVLDLSLHMHTCVVIYVRVDVFRSYCGQFAEINGIWCEHRELILFTWHYSETQSVDHH